jgi:hypothetical protein
MMQKSKLESNTMETSMETLITEQPTKTIDQIRKLGIDKEMRERIAAERAELERAKEEQKSRLPGKFISLKEDREEKILLFSGNWQKISVPATDFVTKEIIPNRTVQKWRFQVFETTDPNNPSESAIFERGRTEASQILDYLDKGDCELVVRRNGRRNDQKTTYTIYPAHR